MQGRHGDILLIAVDSVPQGAELSSDGKAAVLAIGEATGHCHTLTASRVLMWDAAGQKYVIVEGDGGEVTHQEHGVKPVAPGIYHVIHQRETDLAGEWKQVID